MSLPAPPPFRPSPKFFGVIFYLPLSGDLFLLPLFLLFSLLFPLLFFLCCFPCRYPCRFPYCFPCRFSFCCFERPMLTNPRRAFLSSRAALLSPRAALLSSRAAPTVIPSPARELYGNVVLVTLSEPPRGNGFYAPSFLTFPLVGKVDGGEADRRMRGTPAFGNARPSRLSYSSCFPSSAPSGHLPRGGGRF